MMPRAHVLHILPLLEWSGAEKVVAELVLGLPEHGFATSVLGLENGETPYAEILRKKGIAVGGLDLSRRNTLACARALRVAIARMPRPLIVHAHMIHATLAARWAMRNAVRSEDVRVISTTHIVERRFRPWHYWLDAWTASAAAGEICVSEAVRQHQQKQTGLPESFFSVIENGIPLEPFLSISRAADSPTSVVVSIGRLDPQKDFATLLRAWKIVEQSHPTALLKIAGRGSEEAALKALSTQLGLRRATLIGFTENIPALLQTGSLYVQSSLWEGFGLAVAEAMASGLPAVVTAVDSLPSLVEQDRAGVVVPPGDPTATAAALLRLLNDAPQRQKLGESARAIARARFDAKRMCAEHAALYERILPRKES